MRLLSVFALGLVLGISACSDTAASDDPENDDPARPGGKKDGGPNGDDDDDTTTPGDDDDDDGPPATCTMNPDVALNFEERRLVNRLPGKDVPFATEILTGTGFDVFERDFSARLCQDGKAGANSFEKAKELVKGEGTKLWRAAVDRVQGKRTMGTLPAGDDRMLYWARLTMTKTLRAWEPSFALTAEQRGDLEWELERASRGQYDLNLPAGPDFVRIVLSGFDPFTLGAPGATNDVNIRIGNPSGAAALAYDGVTFTLPNGKTAQIETYTLPVNYGPFERGMEEDTLGPVFQAPVDSRANVAITMSQGSGYRFKLEEYNGRFHGTFEGNDDVATCASGFLASTTGCAIDPPARWLGYEPRPWAKDKPPQFVESSLPVDAMIAANTSAQVPAPAGTPGGRFEVVWGYDFEVFPDCTKSATQVFYSSVPYPPAPGRQPPAAAACARSGSGGDYLSNESAYRATLLRDVLGLTIPVGHIHTPIMTRFSSGNGAVTDATFEAYRAAIVAQGRLLVEVVAKSL
ncbi:MAG: hypothetical protein KIT84_04185 [Labilithrix sp.]|nr:hypothetical protein [Labilithrix sp.]MCW5810185.1 hypothetical protein [Labilithrix sp.]